MTETKERRRDKMIALLKSVATRCEGSCDEHRWTRCRHCLAVQELDHRDIRDELKAFLDDLELRESSHV